MHFKREIQVGVPTCSTVEKPAPAKKCSGKRPDCIKDHVVLLRADTGIGVVYDRAVFAGRDSAGVRHTGDPGNNTGGVSVLGIGQNDAATIIKKRRQGLLTVRVAKIICQTDRVDIVLVQKGDVRDAGCSWHDFIDAAQSRDDWDAFFHGNDGQMAQACRGCVVEYADDKNVAERRGFFKMAQVSGVKEIADQIDINSGLSGDRRIGHFPNTTGGLFPATPPARSYKSKPCCADREPRDR